MCISKDFTHPQPWIRSNCLVLIINFIFVNKEGLNVTLNCLDLSVTIISIASYKWVATAKTLVLQLSFSVVTINLLPITMYLDMLK